MRCTGSTSNRSTSTTSTRGATSTRTRSATFRTAVASATGTTTGGSATSRRTASSARSCSRTRCRRSSRASCSSRGRRSPRSTSTGWPGSAPTTGGWPTSAAAIPSGAGIGQIFLNDIDDAIDDVHWIKEHGLRGGVLIQAVAPDVDYVKPLYDPVYDPLWKVCEDLGVPVNSHGGTGARLRQVPGSALLFITRCRSIRSGRSCSCCSRVVRALPEAQVRDDRDGLRVAAADAAPVRRDARADPQDRTHR